jgi:hypothetical protein
VKERWEAVNAALLQADPKCKPKGPPSKDELTRKWRDWKGSYLKVRKQVRLYTTGDSVEDGQDPPPKVTEEELAKGARKFKYFREFHDMIGHCASADPGMWEESLQRAASQGTDATKAPSATT